MNNDKRKKWKWFYETILLWVLMYIITIIIVPLFRGKEITLKDLLIGMLLWGSGGMLNVLIMKIIRKKWEI